MKQKKAIIAFMHVFTIRWLSIMRFDFKEISLVDLNHGKFYKVILL